MGKSSDFGSTDVLACFREFEHRLYEKSEQTFDQVVALSEFRAPAPANPQKFVFVLYHEHNGADLIQLTCPLCVPDYMRQLYQHSAPAAIQIVEPYLRISGELNDAQAAFLLQ